jgi:hypothetical protein
MSEWITPTTIAYVVILILSGVIGVVTMRWRVVIIELKDFFEKYKVAMEDGRLSKQEKEMLVKEGFDVVMALIKALLKLP